jgi:hypothetical protein
VPVVGVRVFDSPAGNTMWSATHPECMPASSAATATRVITSAETGVVW